MIIRKLETNDIKYIDEIADIYSKWWSTNNNIDEIKLDLINSKNIIITKILVDDSKLIGVIQLLLNDNISVLDYKPWLSNLYIKEEYRGNNLSSLLINDIINEAKEIGYKKIYLHSKHVNFYEKYGFSLFYVVDGKRVFYLDL